MIPTNILVIGGGIVGVFAALRARQLRPNARIMLIEQDDALGGLLRSDEHPNGLSFDRGTHVLSQTGIRAIDELLFDGLDPAQWHHFAGAERDLCGLLRDTDVLEGSPFLPAAQPLVARRLDSMAAEPALHVEPNASLHRRLVEVHGPELTDAVFRTPIRNLYRSELEEMDAFVTGQLPLSRVVCDSLPVWLSRMEDAAYRSLVGCPEQRALPKPYASPLKAMYPRRMGIGQLFDKLSAQLADAGVELHLQTRIIGMRVVNSSIVEVSLAKVDGDAINMDGELQVIWAVPPFHLPSMLGLPKPSLSLVAGWRTIIVDFCARLTQPLICYYYIDYGDNDGFRLTNYSALSEEAAQLETSPFTYELWWRGGDIDETQAQSLVAERFLKLGLITAPDAISDLRLRRTAQGAPFATVSNMTALRELAEMISAHAPDNILPIGLLSAPGLFFTGDMLRNAEQRLQERLA